MLTTARTTPYPEDSISPHSASLQLLPSSHPRGLGGSATDVLFQAKHAAVSFPHRLTTSLNRGAPVEGLIDFNGPRHSPVPDHDLHSQMGDLAGQANTAKCSAAPVMPAAVADSQDKELQTILFVSYYFGGGLQPNTHWFVSRRFFFMLRIQFPYLHLSWLLINSGMRPKPPTPAKVYNRALHSLEHLNWHWHLHAMHPAQPTGFLGLKRLTWSPSAAFAPASPSGWRALLDPHLDHSDSDHIITEASSDQPHSIYAYFSPEARLLCFPGTLLFYFLASTLV